MRTLRVQDLGRMEYLTALSRQEELVRQKQHTGGADVLLLAEHPHVFTLGLAGDDKNLLSPRDVPVHRTSRGGDITYHGPGQMVAYPLIDLKSKLRRAVHMYLKNLEGAMIQTVASFGISAERRPRRTGVWLGDKKIAAIGIAVRRGITCHGAALNVNPNLAYFDRIVPCGLPWARVTSLQREVGYDVDLDQVKEVFVDCFAKRFDYARVERLCHEDTPTGSKSEPQAGPTTSVSRGS